MKVDENFWKPRQFFRRNSFLRLHAQYLSSSSTRSIYREAVKKTVKKRSGWPLGGFELGQPRFLLIPIFHSAQIFTRSTFSLSSDFPSDHIFTQPNFSLSQHSHIFTRPTISLTPIFHSTFSLSQIFHLANIFNQPIFSIIPYFHSVHNSGVVHRSLKNNVSINFNINVYEKILF